MFITGASKAFIGKLVIVSSETNHCYLNTMYKQCEKQCICRKWLQTV